MSRFLTIRIGSPTGRLLHDPSGYDVDEWDSKAGGFVFGARPPKVEGVHHTEQPPVPLVAEFRDPQHALQFTSAVALATNNPDERAPEALRVNCALIRFPIVGQWYVINSEDGERTCVGIFADQSDAELFINFMRR